MKIMITGGAGFIGFNLASKFLELGHEVIIYDFQLNHPFFNQDHPGMTPMQGDVLNLGGLTEVFQKTGTDIVVHLAALRNLESQQRPFQAHSVNSTGMVNVLEAARLAGVKRVVYASSAAVYGSASYYRSLNLDPYCVKEWMPAKPYNVYGATKLYNEQMAARYMEIYGVKTVGLRVSIVVGPGKKQGSKTSEFNDVIEAPVRKIAASISSYADQKVNIIFVNDVVHGFVIACTANSCNHSVYNLGGYCINTRELVAAVRNVFPEAQITIEESDKERAVASAIDNTLAKEELGYEPQFSLRDAISNHNLTLARNL
jgi:nucleoside-diphosphate-sugar epimerase